MKRIIRALAAAAALAAILTGCGRATHSSSATSAPSTPVPSANVQVCQDYAKQRAYVRAHEATLTLEDIGTIDGWLSVDADYSTGQLHSDFASEVAGYQRILNGGQPTASQSNAHVRVADDCSAIGVDV